MLRGLVKYKTSDEVDFVIIGSGAAGGVLAKELSANGFRVVVLEQGPYLTEADFVHDEVKVFKENLLTNHPELQPNTFRKTPDEKAVAQRAVTYGRCVGGSSVHLTFHPNATANHWDLKIVFDDDKWTVWTNFDLSTIDDITISYKDGKPWATWK